MSKFMDNFKDVQDFQNQYARVRHIFRNDGLDFDPVEKTPVPKRMKLTDMLALPNATFLIPQVINEFLREAIEPLIIGPSLLARIDYKPGMTLTFPAMGAIDAYDIAPGQEFPEIGPDLGGGEATEIKIQKSGLAIKFLDDLVEQDNFGLMRYWFRLASNALARHKETKIFNYINALGTTLYNNSASPSTGQTGILGTTTGRDATGAFNGTMTHDDFFEAVAFMMSQGFMPNTILMHPLTWSMWIKDPYLRAFAMQAGNMNFFGNWSGSPLNTVNQWGDPIQKLGPTSAGVNADPAAVLDTFNQRQNTAPIFPQYFPFPMRVLVSPFVRFVQSSATVKLTDIIMFDSTNLGALIVKDDIQTMEWKEPSRDITKVKIWESYALALLNRGQGVGIFRNIKVAANELALPAELTVDVSSIPSGSFSGF